LVVEVAYGHRHELGRDGAELQRAHGEALRRLPHGRVLQRAAPDRADEARHHAPFEDVVEDVPARLHEPRAPRGRPVGTRAVETRPPGWRARGTSSTSTPRASD